MTVQPPWTATLSNAEHNLILFGLVATALALTATLVRIRFASAESHGVYRTASLTANSVVAIAAASYVALIVAFLLGYTEQGGVWVPNAVAQLAWSIRYMDWCVTVPLLVVELIAVSSLDDRAARIARTVGIGLALAMIVSGYLGGIVIADGREFTAIATAGGVGALCFVGLYAIVLLTLQRSAPRMPSQARPAYQGAVMLLLVVWLVYPIVYGLQGATSGGAWAVTGQLLLCGADTIAKIGFGSLIHRAAVLRSRADESNNPSSTRPRLPEADAIWVDQDDVLDAPRR
ncbi:bacteriorhodopsin [Amnibacterium endophyticum]|uniref:Bacteriorhodopsin n=1 Tax=Amnibacterium endophyticum TaxID=2109337 RepID=A0ABW4LFL3_9MICO